MKILIMDMAKLKYMPYVKFYLNQIDFSQHEVHLSYWDRDGKEDIKLSEKIILHCFRRDIDDYSRLLKKLPSFLAYRFHMIKVIKSIRPDFLIIHNQTTAFLVIDLLLSKYKSKYILDYRDVTYENNRLFRSAVAKMVKSSRATFVSSEGFRPYLPENEHIYTIHNFNKNEIPLHISVPRRESNDKIRISFWGLVRHPQFNKKIIERLGNDSRFELDYYGRAQQEILDILKCAERTYDNIHYHGEYSPEERASFAEKTDLIHNLYGNDDATMPHAMANKFYDGLLFRLPQLCMKGSYMADNCELYGVGLACDPDEADFADKIYNYYLALDKEKLYAAIDSCLNKILAEMEFAEKKIYEILN